MNGVLLFTVSTPVLLYLKAQGKRGACPAQIKLEINRQGKGFYSVSRAMCYRVTARLWKEGYLSRTRGVVPNTDEPCFIYRITSEGERFLSEADRFFARLSSEAIVDDVVLRRV